MSDVTGQPDPDKCGSAQNGRSHLALTEMLWQALGPAVQVLGRHRQLDQVIRGVPPVDPEVRVVTHADERAFTTVALLTRPATQPAHGRFFR